MFGTYISGNHSYVWKTNLRILSNYILKNFQIKHGQCDRIAFAQNIFFWRLEAIGRLFETWPGHVFEEELTKFVLKATRIFPIPTQTE